VPDSPITVLKRLADRWNAHDLDAVYGLMHPDYREYLNGALIKQGAVAARAADQPIYETVPDYRREVDELYADDKGGAIRWRFLGTGPNGLFEVPLASTYRIDGGKIVEAWIYGDPMALARALGLAVEGAA